MGAVRPTESAAFLLGGLCRDPDVLTHYMGSIKGFSDPKITSPLLLFDFTDYYTPTMGAPLYRRFYLYTPGFDPARLPEIKLRTNALEAEAARSLDLGVERPLNLDPGYLTRSKLVLASTKDHAHRIYLRDGIFGEVTLHFSQKSYRSRPWTFPDYASEGYVQFFNEVRKRLF